MCDPGPLDAFTRTMQVLEPIAKRDRDAAVDVYGAMCNVLWVPLDHPATTYQEARAMAPLNDPNMFTTTWRYAGQIVADLREQGENYLDFYCSGNESVVTDEIREAMAAIGLRPVV